MITEDYCSYEVNKLLLDKGFPFMCNVGALWVDKQGKTKLHSSFAPITWVNEDDADTPCVTQELAMKWLREEHHIYIGINPISGEGYNATIYDVADFDDYGIVYDTGCFFHVEEAVDTALKYCLTNLDKLCAHAQKI